MQHSLSRLSVRTSEQTSKQVEARFIPKFESKRKSSKMPCYKGHEAKMKVGFGENLPR
jgi:hypothetical protein